jgi:hypothetical protein
LGELCREESTPFTFRAMFWVFENQGNSQEENKLREKYDVPIPSDKELFGQIAKDKLAREEGCS